MLETPNIASFFTILAQADGGQQSPMSFFLMIGLFMAGFWFLIVAPQRKMQKEHDALVKGLKKGDKIMTKGGVFGTIVNVKSDRVSVKVANNTNIEISKPFIQTVLNKKDDAKSDEAAEDTTDEPEKTETK